MLYYNLRDLFKARGIDNPFTIMVKSGISHAAAHQMLNNSTRNLKLRHIEILCKILVCQPNDLLVWVPDKDVVYTEDYPLRELQKNPDISGLDVFADMPLKKLQEVVRAVKNNNQ